MGRGLLAFAGKNALRLLSGVRIEDDKLNPGLNPAYADKTHMQSMRQRKPQILPTPFTHPGLSAVSTLLNNQFPATTTPDSLEKVRLPVRQSDFFKISVARLNQFLNRRFPGHHSPTGVCVRPEPAFRRLPWRQRAWPPRSRLPFWRSRLSFPAWGAQRWCRPALPWRAPAPGRPPCRP